MRHHALIEPPSICPRFATTLVSRYCPAELELFIYAFPLRAGRVPGGRPRPRAGGDHRTLGAMCRLAVGGGYLQEMMSTLGTPTKQVILSRLPPRGEVSEIALDTPLHEQPSNRTRHSTLHLLVARASTNFRATAHAVRTAAAGLGHWSPDQEPVGMGSNTAAPSRH